MAALSVLCIEMITIDLTVLWDFLRKCKDLHATTNGVHYGVIRCFIWFYHENGNYFTRFNILVMHDIKTRLFAPKKTNNGIQPKLNAVVRFFSNPVRQMP
ncbi:MAG: hypothetical protein GX633_00615 [Clostridiales bacterium]|nr:hypothetical protein [Clostridiales bacterium]